MEKTEHSIQRLSNDYLQRVELERGSRKMVKFQFYFIQLHIVSICQSEYITFIAPQNKNKFKNPITCLNKLL